MCTILESVPAELPELENTITYEALGMFRNGLPAIVKWKLSAAECAELAFTSSSEPVRFIRISHVQHKLLQQ